MILVTGATGRLGGAVIDQLLARTAPSDIAALARDAGRAEALGARGVSVRIGDYDSPESLAAAMDGVDRVVLIASNQFAVREQQHQNVVDAARTAGVELIGFTSRSLLDPSTSHDTILADLFVTETSVQNSGIASIIFRNALYLDVLPLLVGGPAVYQHGIRLPTDGAEIAAALRREMGEAMANAMLDWSGGDHTYVLAATEAYSYDDIARSLTEISGSTVTNASVGDDEFVAHAVAMGLPEPMATRLTESFIDIRAGQVAQTSGDLESLLGHAPASLTAALAELFPVPTGG